MQQNPVLDVRTRDPDARAEASGYDEPAALHRTEDERSLRLNEGDSAADFQPPRPPHQLPGE